MDTSTWSRGLYRWVAGRELPGVMLVIAGVILSWWRVAWTSAVISLFYWTLVSLQFIMDPPHCTLHQEITVQCPRGMVTVVISWHVPPFSHIVVTSGLAWSVHWDVWDPNGISSTYISMKCHFFVCFILWFSTVLTGQSSDIFSGLRQSDEFFLEVYYNGQWLPVLPCSSVSNECNCEYLWIGMTSYNLGWCYKLHKCQHILYLYGLCDMLDEC